MTSPEPRSLDWLAAAERTLHARLADVLGAVAHEQRTAVEVALSDFEQHLRRWTEAEEVALIPAVERVGVPGRDARREIHLEFVQLRELTAFLVRQIAGGLRLRDLAGYFENLDRRLRAHDEALATTYYPIAAKTLTPDEWALLERARPVD